MSRNVPTLSGPTEASPNSCPLPRMEPFSSSLLSSLCTIKATDVTQAHSCQARRWCHAVCPHSRSQRGKYVNRWRVPQAALLWESLSPSQRSHADSLRRVSILTKHEWWPPFLTGRSGQFVHPNRSQEHAHCVPADRCPGSRWELPRAD